MVTAGVPQGGGFVDATAFTNIAEPFLACVHAYPDRTAVVFGADSRTYAEANADINRIVHVLQDLGIRSGDKVAYLLPNCLELIELYYAIQKLGAIAVPINFRSIASELAYFTKASDAKILVFATQFADTVSGARPELAGVETLLCSDGDALGVHSMPRLMAVADQSEPEMFRHRDAVSRIQFTGGTTGRPKGAERTHRADLVEIEGTYKSNNLHLDEAKVVLIQCPLEHHGGHDWFCTSLSVGSTLIICASFDPESILRQIAEHRVSYMILLPPSTYVRLMSHPDIGTYDLSSVRLVQSSAGGTSPEIVRDIYRWFPNCVMNYGWGQTESGLGSSLVITREMASIPLPQIHSVGTPMPLAEMRIIDEVGNPVPDGIVGEAAFRSQAVMKGYYRQPELTAQAFTPDGWLRTGDMMVRDASGFYYLKSRKRELIKSGGENVFVGEVENVVRSHPNVLDVLVFGVPDEIMGEAVAAVVELRPGTTITLDELQQHCREQMASYKKPRYLEILDTLDRDFSGKVNRTRVIARAREQRAIRASKADVADIATVIDRVSDVPEVHRIRVPLPRPGLATWSYLIRGTERDLLVDPGFDTEVAQGVLVRALAHLEVARDRLDIFVTHEHADHLGLTPRIRTEQTRVFMSRAAVEAGSAVGVAAAEEALAHRLATEGFDRIDIVAFEHIRRQAVKNRCPGGGVTEVTDGEVIEVGPHRLRVIATPGHTAGHLCLYEPQHGLLFLGDHVLFHMSPTAFAGGNALAAYFDSLAKVAALDVRLPFPAHGPVDSTLADRASDLRSHHEGRLAYIADLVAGGVADTAATIARQVPWNVPFSTWEGIPVIQKWPIAIATLAYLDLLVARCDIVRAESAGMVKYLPPPGSGADTKGTPDGLHDH